MEPSEGGLESAKDDVVATDPTPPRARLALRDQRASARDGEHARDVPDVDGVVVTAGVEQAAVA